MSSTSSPVKIRSEPKMLLRSTSFQKLCSIPYNFKIDSFKSYKEHIKTIINLLKVATRSYVISLYFNMVSIILFNNYAVAKWNFLKINYRTTSDSNNSRIANATATKPAALDTVPSTRYHQPKNGKSITLGGLLDNPIVEFQAFLTYSCIGYLGIQMAWLANALYLSANIPLGLVFLMLDLGYMGFIILKIAFNHTN